MTPLAILLGVAGAAWGWVSDRIAARWPEHEDGSIRAVDWRTLVVVAAGAVALAAVAGRFDGPLERVVFGSYVLALVLLLATDLDQRLLPDLITLPLIPLAGLFSLAGLNPLVPVADLPIAAVAAVGLPLLLAVLAFPFGAGAIGMGDLKLLVSAGLLVGAGRLVTGVVWGALLAGVVILVLLAARRITLRSYIPFGPFLIAGALWAILGGT
ncbi:MAG TPA: A24 family peptidase [Candidatus Limnocylindrales bacterium]|nr:A24 family peptidase [Candidatus Limnocylindrales bacterium]